MTTKTRHEKLAPVGDRGMVNALGPRVYRFIKAVPTWVLWFIVVLWTVPTMGLFVNSFRTRDAQRASGWWEIFTGGEAGFTIENYADVLSAGQDGGFFEASLNSLAIAVPATVIPIAIAAFAAYAFAWMDFKGREWTFIVTVSLLAIPLQMSLIPLLQTYSGGAHWTLPYIGKTITVFPYLNYAGSTTAVWLTHTGFALPFAIFLLHNYIAGLPRDIMESAQIDGASHYTIFMKLVLPLSVPVLAAFAIFQFLWTWNDYLVALTMIGGSAPDQLPATIKLVSLSGFSNTREHLLTAAAFVQIALPVIVFFSLQRFFVRGILAGSVKG